MNTDFDEFYRVHHVDAVRWASALVGSREIGEELAQDAMIAVVGRFGALDSPVAYLRRTIVNRAMSWHRWNVGERRRMLRACAGEATSYTSQTNEMSHALGSLTSKQRTAVVLRYWADWTDEQIAESLGCAPATVRVLLHRGLAILKKEITT